MSKSNQVRNKFIDFFKNKFHVVVPSSPVIPVDDPTLLFTNAGMNQFKDVFLEQGSRSYTRAVNSQKIIRVSGKHNDLELVGLSHNHHTFFEMLGNWSFGDYYKREAIRWAWELITEEYRIDPSRLYATIYEGDDQVPRDDEARAAWLEETSISADRISTHGKADNFWEMGEVGPCGPCSELHYDFGEELCSRRDVPGHRCEVNSDCGRIVEIWNLVFIQYRRDESGTLHPLPRWHVDTGAGFERILKIVEGVSSNYETSLFKPLVAFIENLSGEKYHGDKRGIPHRVAADHVRALSFALADGVLPSNEGRGYVLRRILRRAARFGREIGLETPFLYKMVDPLTDTMGDAYPELKERCKHISGVILAEEESFARTLGRGLELFGEVAEQVSRNSSKEITGRDAFKLYDTYGFPLDLTELMARERGFTVDTAAFNELMKEQRIRARGDGKFSATTSELGSGLKSNFTGYSERKTAAKVISVSESAGKLDLILDFTPFYAEAGGQVSDLGEIETSGGKLTVSEVTKTGDAIIHHGKWSGSRQPRPGDSATAIISSDRRLNIMYNHTATHLLHTALRTHIGKHAAQAGSLVAPDRLRFDFTHFEKLSPEMIELLEVTVNKAIRANYPVTADEKPFKEALESGVTALFGEKYGDIVRIICIGDPANPYSRELCGGTHVSRTGQLGCFRIVYEGAVSAGVRRIEAATGEYTLNMALADRRDLRSVEDLIDSHGSNPVEKLAKVLEEKKALEKEFRRLLDAWARGTAEKLISNAVTVGDIQVISRNFETMEIDRLKMIGDAIRNSAGRFAALLSSPTLLGAGQLCSVVSDNVIAEGVLKAGSLVSKAAKAAGGGGGGKPHMATAGTKKPDLLGKAVKEFPGIIREALG